MEDLITAAGRQLLYSTLLFAAVWGFCRWRRPSAAVEHGLWSLVLLRLALPPGLAFAWSLRALVERALQLVAALLPAPVRAAAEGGSDGLAAAGLLPTTALGTAGSSAWLWVLSALWAAGSLGLGLAILLRLRGLRRLLSAAREIDDPILLSALGRWRGALRIRRRVRLVASGDSLVPFTQGLFRPVIFLPETLRRCLSAAELESVIAHELAHVRRRDALWIRLENLLQILYFFHPVVWLAGRRLRCARERLCDRRVLAEGVIPPARYGESLLKTLKIQCAGTGGIETVPALGLDHGRFTMRIHEILHAPTRRPNRLQAGTAASRLVLFALALLFLPMGPLGTSEAAPGTSEAARRIALGNPLPEGRLTSAFGDRRDPFTRQRILHPGVDLSAPAGTEIVAPAQAEVVAATDSYKGRENHGKVVVLDHGDGIRTYYAQLEGFVVEPGQKIKAGQPIGRVGSSGRSTGPHLHFEVWKNGEPQDPVYWVSDWTPKVRE